jgi:hypothetical protein
MITIEDVKRFAKEHPIGNGGKATLIENKVVKISIVGGASGLYGDFEKDFELAIMDQVTGDFITKFFIPEANDDVVGYMNGPDLERVINSIIRNNDFQVR